MVGSPDNDSYRRMKLTVLRKTVTKKLLSTEQDGDWLEKMLNLLNVLRYCHLHY